MLHLLRVEPEQSRDAGGGRERSRGTGCMKDPVVGAAEKFADAHSCFVTRDRAGDEILAGRPGLLRDSQHGGEDDGAGMQHRAIVQVILFNIVGGCTVDERREERRSLPA